MKRVLFLVLLSLFFSGSNANAQKLPAADLYRLSEMAAADIRDYLQTKGYKLEQLDSSSAAISWYFTAIDKDQQISNALRSVTVMETSYKDYAGKLLSYRTYDQEEHRQFMDYLARHGFRLTDSYKKNKVEDFFYSDGVHTVHYTIVAAETDKGKTLPSYSFEIGG